MLFVFVYNKKCTPLLFANLLTAVLVRSATFRTAPHGTMGKTRAQKKDSGAQATDSSQQASVELVNRQQLNTALHVLCIKGDTVDVVTLSSLAMPALWSEVKALVSAREGWGEPQGAVVFSQGRMVPDDAAAPSVSVCSCSTRPQLRHASEAGFNVESPQRSWAATVTKLVRETLDL